MCGILMSWQDMWNIDEYCQGVCHQGAREAGEGRHASASAMRACRRIKAIFVLSPPQLNPANARWASSVMWQQRRRPQRLVARCSAARRGLDRGRRRGDGRVSGVSWGRGPRAHRCEDADGIEDHFIRFGGRPDYPQPRGIRPLTGERMVNKLTKL
jgi:hypothetical protein